MRELTSPQQQVYMPVHSAQHRFVDPRESNGHHYQCTTNSQGSHLAYQDQVPRSTTSVIDAFECRQLPLPAKLADRELPIRPPPQGHPGAIPLALAPIQTTSYQQGSSAFPSPVETTASTSFRTASISDSGNTSSGDETDRIPASTRHGKPQKGSYATPDAGSDVDEYATRKSLLPHGGKPIIPPGVDYGGPRRTIRQKQNCGRHAKNQNRGDDLGGKNEAEKRKLSKKTDHTHAERIRRNEHKNLLIDIYYQTPLHYLDDVEWTDKNKDPTKQQILAANVRYQVDLAQRCTDQHYELEALKSKYVESERAVAHHRQENQQLRRHVEDSEKRLAMSVSTRDTSVPEHQRSSTARYDTSYTEGHVHQLMEPRIVSGPPTPTLSASGRSSPICRSRPISRAGSPVRTLLPSMPPNGGFGFPAQPKRKPHDTWVVAPPQHHELKMMSPKRRCYG